MFCGSRGTSPDRSAKITRIYSLFAIVGLNTLLLLAAMELGARAYIRYFAEERWLMDTS